MYMRQSWLDERLQHNLTKITLSYHYGDILWVPDLFFRNEKKAHVHDVAHPNKLITVEKNGWVTYSQRCKIIIVNIFLIFFTKCFRYLHKKKKKNYFFFYCLFT